MRRNPDLIQAYLDYTSGHEASPKIHLWSFLSVLAACLQRKVWMKRGYYTLYPNLYVFIIGKSGLVKKSTSTAIAVNLYREIEGAPLMSERLTAGSLIRQMKEAGSFFEYKGEPIKQSPVFAYASELAVFMSEVFGSITEILTTFYDCIPNDPSKPWTYNTVGQGWIKIYGPCLNMLGASTPSWLKRCIPQGEMEGGFSSRIIFVVENEAPEKLVAWPELDKDLDLMRLSLVEDLRQVYSMCGEVTVTPTAKTLFAEWYERHMREILPMNSDPKIAGYMGRKGDHILKIAMLRSVSLREDLVITESEIIWACEKLDALENDMRDAFGDNPYIKSHGHQLAFEIRNYIKNRLKVSKEELFKAFQRKASGTDVLNGLKTLIDIDEILVNEIEKDGKMTTFYLWPQA